MALRTNRATVGCPNPDPAAFKNLLAGLGTLTGTTDFPRYLNDYQLPTGTAPNTITSTISMPADITSADEMVLAWDGTCANGASAAFELRRTGGFTVISDPGSAVVGGTSLALAVKGTDGYVEFNIGSGTIGAITLNFFGGATFTDFSTLIFCRKSDYNSIVNATSAGDLIRDDYVAALQALALGGIRPMGWGNPNDSNTFTQHRYRNDWLRAGAYGKKWVPSCWAGGPGTAGPNITGLNTLTADAATDTPVAYTHGEVLQGYNETQSTATATINVGARGAVPIFTIFGTASISGTVQVGNCTLIYDSVLGGYIYTNSGISARVPIETQIGLANRVGCVLWYNIPPHFTDDDSVMEPVSSVEQVALLMNSTCQYGGGLEFANEIWNIGGGFEATTWAGFSGAALGFPNTNGIASTHSFYGFKTAKMMSIVKAAAPSLKRFLMWQAAGPSTLNDPIARHRWRGYDLNARATVVTAVSSSATTPTVTTQAAHNLPAGTGVVHTNLTGDMGTLLNGVTVYVATAGLTSTAYRLSSSASSDVMIDTSGATAFSGTANGQTKYSYLGHADYSTVGNRPGDIASAFGYGIYYCGAQLRNFDANYAGTGIEASFTINGATSANPVVFQTSSAHGYSTGDRIFLGANGGGGTNFTAPWATPFNGTSHFVTVIDTTHFSVPVDASALAAYSANGGSARRYPDVSGLTAWADLYALGTQADIDTALAALDNDIRQGTNHGLTNMYTLARFISQIYTTWETRMAELEVTRPDGEVELWIYEGAFEGFYPTTASCTSLGISTTYGGSTGLVANLLTGYKNSTYFYRTATQQIEDLLTAHAGRAVYPSWFTVTGASQWSGYPLNSVTASPRFESMDAIENFNKQKRRFVIRT